MATSGNQYADKVFSEHPIALWSLDEDLYYISLIDDNDRLFSTWTLSNCTSSNSPSLPDSPSPFDSDIYSSLTATSTSPSLIEAESSNTFDPSMINSENNTFCVNFFMYQKPTYINWIKVGYRYLDALGVSQEVLSNEIPAPQIESWVNFNNVYDLPTSWSGSIKLVIQVNFDDSSGGDDSSRTLIMNGLSVGQGSETTCYASLGDIQIPLPESLGISGVNAISADQYGILSDNGYYLARNNSLLAHNDGFPIIYGTDHSTKIYPSSVNLPSFVFPGKGILHEKGRNKQYTLEMWIKIDVSTNTARRIIGPLGSTDGIYVKEGFLTLVVGDQISSHCVSEWYRPMLIHLIIKENNIVFFINGEEVINIPFDRATVDLSNEADWWGIYSYPSISMFHIDCISIYPYSVSNLVAKRRFVYGQGTPSIQSIDNSFKGTPTTIDFSTAEYSSNIIYPDIARWDAGYFNNLNATKNYLSVPDYELPIISLGGRDVAEWYSDNYIINSAEYPEGNHPKFVTFRPNTGTRTNLILNPSGESTYDVWAQRGTANGQDTSIAALFGSYVTKHVSAATSQTTYIRYYTFNNTQRIPVEAGQTYTGSGYVKADIGNLATNILRARIYFYDNFNNIVGSPAGTNTPITPGGDWVRLSITAEAPSTAVSAFLDFSTTEEVVSQTWYYDGVMFENSSELLPYFDGSYADPAAKAISTSWSGTPNASTSTVSYWNPNGTNYTSPSYLNFQSLNILNDAMAAVYGIFEVEEDIEEARTLMSFVNITNGETLDINIEGDQVKYSIDGNIFYSESIIIGSETLVGINFERIGIEFGYNLSRFFSSPSSVQLYVGGNGINTFEGKIYVVGFCNQTNYEKISENFNSNGIAKKNNYEILIDHFASYTLMPEYEYSRMYLDISVSSEWEEYFPLTYFASYVKDENGNPYYDLDMLQVNLGYASTETQDVWNYLQLEQSYDGQTYQDLKDSIYSNYFNLKKNNTTGGTVNVTSSLKGYLTFQPIAEGANSPLSNFIYEKGLTESFVIDPDLENTSILPEKAYQTKFSFKDNVIVYPPKTKSFEDYAMVAHLQINQRSILKNPLKIKSFEISSKNLNYPSTSGDESQRNYIGTKFGTNIYTEIDVFNEIDYKSKNPYIIYKTSTPYIYTTKKSGIQLVNRGSITSPTTIKEYRAAIPVNANGSYNYNVSAINFIVMGNLPDVNDEIPLLNVNHKNGIISLILNKTENGTLIKAYNKSPETVVEGGLSSTEIYADTWNAEYSDSLTTFIVNVTAGSINPTETLSQYTEISGVNFYQNGKYVKTPYIKNNEWNSIAISFDDSLDFGEFYEGSIDLFGGFVFNNISYYLEEGLDAKTDLTIRTWDGVLNQDYNGVPVTPENTWSYWSALENTWQTVYILGKSSSYISSPIDIYKAYTGTNKSIVDDGYGMQLQQRDTAIITDVSWLSYTDKPA